MNPPTYPFEVTSFFMDDPAENFTPELLNWSLIFPKKIIYVGGPQIDIQMQCYITSSAKVNYLLIDWGIFFTLKYLINEYSFIR